MPSVPHIMHFQPVNPCRKFASGLAVILPHFGEGTALQAKQYDAEQAALNDNGLAVSDKAYKLLAVALLVFQVAQREILKHHSVPSLSISENISCG